MLLIRDRSIDLSEHRVMLCNNEKETGFDSRTWKVTSVDVVGLLDLLNISPHEEPNCVYETKGERGVI